MMVKQSFFGVFAISLSLVGSWGCSDKETDYGAPLSDPEPVALRGAVALKDDALGRILFVTAQDADELKVQPVRVGKNVASVRASHDGSRLFVLSRGVYPRRSQGDERPQLAVYDGGEAKDTAGKLVKSFFLDDPMEKLALDSRGQWVAAFGGDATVVNPNELVLLDLSSGEAQLGKTQSKTIRSFGGAPLELIFTEELSVPEGGSRRLLIVRTDRDVTLVDLKDLDKPEVTIKLPEGAGGVTLSPQQIVYDDGDPDDDEDARLAIRLENSSDVVLVQLGPSSVNQRDFSPVLNIVDVGGVPSAIDFVRTDGGLRLAALLPAQSRATLVNPKTTLAEVVNLPSSFSQMRRITSAVSDAPEGGDVALLWGATKEIAFWSLGSTSETPYRSIDTAELSFVVSQVLDVGAPNAHLKVLRGSSSDLFVLDLDKRQSFPLSTDFVDTNVTVSSDGERVWAFETGRKGFSSVRLADLHPQALYVDAPVSGVFDLARADGGRAALVFHFDRGWSATLLDAEVPDSAETRYFPSLDLVGLK